MSEIRCVYDLSWLMSIAQNLRKNHHADKKIYVILYCRVPFPGYSIYLKFTFMTQCLKVAAVGWSSLHPASFIKTSALVLRPTSHRCCPINRTICKKQTLIYFWYQTLITCFRVRVSLWFGDYIWGKGVSIVFCVNFTICSAST